MRDEPELQIGVWTVRPARNRLERGDRTVRIEPRAMDVLVCLAGRAGQVVSLEELLRSVWAGMVVGDGSVYLAVSQLRSVLGKTDAGAPYIETIRKRGYRLTVPVSRLDSQEAESGRNVAEEGAPFEAKGLPHRASNGARRPWLMPVAVSIGLCLLVALLAVIPRFDASPIGEPVPASVAVLPIANLSTDPDNAFYAVALQTEIANRLGSIGGLTVIPPSVTSRYVAPSVPMLDVARTLRAEAFLTGSVEVRDSEIRVAVDLVDSRSGGIIWGRSYAESLSDVFAVQADIARNVAVGLDAGLSSSERARLARAPTQSEEAYALYSRGTAALETADSVDTTFEALDFFDAAVRVDPEFAVAHAMKGVVYAILAAAVSSANAPDDIDAVELVGRARAEASRALGLDEVSEAHAVLAITHDIEGNTGAARASFERAIQLDPNDADILSILADVELRAGRHARARELLARAARTDPEYLLMSVKFLLWAGESEEWIVEASRRYVDISPGDYRGWVALGLLALVKDDIDEAKRHFGLAVQLVGEARSPGLPDWLAILAYGHGRLDNDDAARRAFDRFVSNVPEPEQVNPASWTYAYLAIGDLERAYDWAVRASQGPLPPYVSPQHAFMRNTTHDPRLEQAPFLELRQNMLYAQSPR